MSQRRSFVHLGLGALAVAGIALTGASCVAKSPSSVSCGEEVRPSIDCSSEIPEGDIGVLNLASEKATFEDVAIRRISAETEKFVAAHTRLCRDYNACAIDKAKYDEEKKALLKLLSPVGSLVAAVKQASSEEERQAALDALYQHTVPEAERKEELTLTLSMEAELPESAGGGTRTVKPDEPLPTNARVFFKVEVKPRAYVYIFQNNASSGLTVLFPDERIGTKNPLEGESRIPNGDLRFRLNEKDLGFEDIYIAASRTPLRDLDEALARVRDGKITRIKDDKLLDGMKHLPVEGAGAKKDAKCRDVGLERCPRIRGLELDLGGASGLKPGSKPPSLMARTEPGDGLLMKVFSFQHTGEGAAYKDAAEKFSRLPAPKTRGGVIIERTRTRGGVIIE
ncbi:DUF4384 domain-containing protein [Polyangium sp. y55x31]|uniref:DUF4384 domain-containing protein n=1 Tax=Polyangium sp. y55x31 TaxID=3042688 RepID=UPI00248241AA|nr:DUF4384 domain-containing protein [Polyangium sp. y55x31]MDI1482785.1 DUF4384 domain-containing protein [Polyangium sp. y55x31]